jgi:hypothetical protein
MARLGACYRAIFTSSANDRSWPRAAVHRSESFVCFPTTAEPTSSMTVDNPSIETATPDTPAANRPSATTTQAIEKQWTIFKVGPD